MDKLSNDELRISEETSACTALVRGARYALFRVCYKHRYNSRF